MTHLGLLPTCLCLSGGPRLCVRVHSVGSRVCSDRGVGPSTRLLPERHQSQQQALQCLVGNLEPTLVTTAWRSRVERTNIRKQNYDFKWLYVIVVKLWENKTQIYKKQNILTEKNLHQQLPFTQICCDIDKHVKYSLEGFFNHLTLKLLLKDVLHGNVDKQNHISPWQQTWPAYPVFVVWVNVISDVSHLCLDLCSTPVVSSDWSKISHTVTF